VTVALKEVDSLKVNLAQKFGPLYLTLRKLGDPTPALDKEFFTADELFKPSKRDKKGSPSDTEASEGTENGNKKVDEIPEIPQTKEETKVPEPKKNDEPKNMEEIKNIEEPKERVNPPKVNPPTKDEPKVPTTKIEDTIPPIKNVEQPKQVDEPKDAEEVKPAPKRYFHTITFRQGDKQWKQVIEVDAKGRPISDDVQQDGSAEAAPPTVSSPPTVTARPTVLNQPPTKLKKTRNN